ncbi:MAG: hypothetical protein E6R04_11510 [Spirochaetes bacterium]|nr:MAG: hypothetical protein E6R04_11510 [Spirochaetota bacterium]
MEVLVKILIGVVLFALVVAVWFGVTAAMAWVMMHLFNYIMVNTNHAGSQISFWVSFAAVVLLGLIGGFFRSDNSKGDK